MGGVADKCCMLYAAGYLILMSKRIFGEVFHVCNFFGGTISIYKLIDLKTSWVNPSFNPLVLEIRYFSISTINTSAGILV